MKRIFFLLLIVTIAIGVTANEDYGLGESQGPVLYSVMLHYDSDDCSDEGSIVSSKFLTDDPLWAPAKEQLCVRGTRIMGFYETQSKADAEIAKLYKEKFLTIKFPESDIELNYPMGDCLAWPNELRDRSLKFELWGGDVMLVSMYKNLKCEGLASYMDEKHLMPENIRCSGFQDLPGRTIVPNSCLAPVFSDAWGSGDEAIESMYQEF